MANDGEGALMELDSREKFRELMRSWWEFNLSLSFDRQPSFSVTVSRALSSILNMFKVSTRVDLSSSDRQLSGSLIDSLALSLILNVFKVSIRDETSHAHYHLIANSSALSSTLQCFHQLWTSQLKVSTRVDKRVPHVCWATLVLVSPRAWQLNKFSANAVHSTFVYSSYTSLDRDSNMLL